MAKRAQNKSAKAFAAKRDFQRFAKTCRTCQGWGDLIHDVVAEWIEAGDGYANLTALWEWLVEEHEYPFTYDAMWQHLKRHEYELFKALRTKKSG